MGVFSGINSSEANLQKPQQADTTAAKRRSRPSDAEIREKLMNRGKKKMAQEATQVELSSKAKEKAQAAKKEVQNIAAPEGPAPERADIADNNPEDPTTVKKLKSALTSGMVSFSPQTSQVLAQIIKERESGENS